VPFRAPTRLTGPRPSAVATKPFSSRPQPLRRFIHKTNAYNFRITTRYFMDGFAGPCVCAGAIGAAKPARLIPRQALKPRADCPLSRKNGGKQPFIGTGRTAGELSPFSHPSPRASGFLRYRRPPATRPADHGPIVIAGLRIIMLVV